VWSPETIDPLKIGNIGLTTASAPVSSALLYGRRRRSTKMRASQTKNDAAQRSWTNVCAARSRTPAERSVRLSRPQTGVAPSIGSCKLVSAIQIRAAYTEYVDRPSGRNQQRHGRTRCGATGRCTGSRKASAVGEGGGCRYRRRPRSRGRTVVLHCVVGARDAAVPALSRTWRRRRTRDGTTEPTEAQTTAAFDEAWPPRGASTTPARARALRRRPRQTPTKEMRSIARAGVSKSS